ncbi:MAG: DUF1579 domain-containing protein [Deltaproteobacteria bacterium]
MRILIGFLAVLAACASAPAAAPTRTEEPAQAPAAVPAVKPTESLVEPMHKLDFMRGIWAGPASGVERDGKAYKVTQVERIGPMLGGDIVVIEGRGFRDDNTTGFNAFAVASYDRQTQKYELRSYAQGYSGTFEMKLTATGYVWEIPSGPHAVTRFTATITPTTWREVGEFVAEGAPAAQIFEMNLKRVGDTDWPLGTPPSPSVGR